MAQRTGTLAPSHGCSQPIPARTQKTVPRRLLAPNVVCLFAQNRAPIVNAPRRGRYPKNVTPISSRPRLMPGDIAQLWGDRAGMNFGKVVRIAEPVNDRTLPGGQWWRIESLFEPLDHFDVDTRKPTGTRSWKGIAEATRLRRLSNLIGSI